MKNPKIHPLKINFEIQISSALKLPRFVYLFVIEGEKLHFIDSGVAPAFVQIQTFIKSINKDIAEVENIFLTHSHPDHIGAAKLIQQESKCMIYAPNIELEWITNTDKQYQQRPVPGFFDLVAGSVSVNSILNEIQVIHPENNITLKVISTPGHSAGSTSFYYEEQKALFCGDAVLLPGEIPIFENIHESLNSLEKIKQLEPEILFSSWDQPRKSREISEILEQSKTYILAIQNVAKKISKHFDNHNSIEFCKAVLTELGLNKSLANPLLIKSFSACLKD